MKKTLTILRSIVTSLLFLLLVFVISIQFFFATIFINNKRIPDMIDEKTFLYNIIDEKFIENEEVEKILIDYIKDYKNYVFYKRSYPSIETISLDALTDEDKYITKDYLQNLKKSMNIEYSTITKIRNTTNLMTNGSIFLLINIATFVSYIILVISILSFKKGTKFLGIALSLSGIITIIINTSLTNTIKNLSPITLKLFLENIITNNLSPLGFKLSLIYISIGLILFFVLFIYDKLIKKS